MTDTTTLNATDPLTEIYAVRHGETMWSASGLHTSRTDIPLTAQGEEEARKLVARLQGIKFAAVLSSPLLRARRTCELAGLGATPEITAELKEWDYGDYEGRTSAQIWQDQPGWNLFCDGCPGGESPARIAARADALVDRLRLMRGRVAIFSHGHFLRSLAARWVGLPVSAGQHLALDTGSLGIFSHDRSHAKTPVIALWNERIAHDRATPVDGHSPQERAHDPMVSPASLH